MERRGPSASPADTEEFRVLWAKFAALFRGKRLMRHAPVFLRTIRVFDRHARLTRTETFSQVMAAHVAKTLERLTDAEARELAPQIGIDPDKPSAV